MRPPKNKWAKKRWGLEIGLGHDYLTNLRSADDLLLISRSRGQVTKMLSDLICEANKAWLKIHPGTTKVLFNGVGRKAGPVPGVIRVEGHDIEVLADNNSTMYFGRALNLHNGTEVEIRHRIRVWSKFSAANGASIGTRCGSITLYG